MSNDLSKIVLSFQREFKSFRKEFVELRKEFKELRGEFNLFREETSGTLAQHTHTLMTIENTMGFYGDMYKINKESIQNLDHRVIVLEAK